ncbi:MAG: tetratricopeptide repeat protein [Chitinophagales bacterium]
MRIIIIFIVLLLSLPFVGRSNNEKVDSLHQILNNSSFDSVKIATLNQIALEYFKTLPDTGIIICRTALNKAKKLSNSDLKGDCYYTLTLMARKQGEAVNAHIYIDSAVTLYQKSKDAYAEIKAYLLKARTYGMFGDFSKCVEYSTQLLLKIDSLNYPEFKPDLLNLIGLGHMDLEQNDEAYEYFQQALEEAKKQDDKQVKVWAYNNLSSYFRHTKRFDEAIEYLGMSNKLAREIADHDQIGGTYSNLGATYHKMNLPDSAEYYLKKAYNYYHDQKMEYGLVTTSWHLGEFYVDNNQPDLARPFLRESLQLAQKLNLDDDICYAYEYLYKAESQSGNYDLASQLADSLFECKENFYNRNLSKQLLRATTLYEKAILEKETLEQKSAIEKLEIGRRNNQRIIFLISLLAFLSLLIGYLYTKNKRAKERLELDEFYQLEATKKLEEDRKNRAAELHDDIGQQLVLMKQMIENNSDLQESKIMLQKAIDRVRAISRDEYPYQLKYLGLKTTLEDLIDRIENSSSIVVSEGFEDLPELSIESSLHVFRIVQECFSNTLKYSGAPSVQVKLSKDDNYLIMTYQDSGNPFDFQNKLMTSHSLGLKTIMDRVSILKGKVKELPSKGKGNKYIIHIPLSNIDGTK